jgi:tetratricopeptide (TPR) repeat protein
MRLIRCAIALSTSLGVLAGCVGDREFRSTRSEQTLIARWNSTPTQNFEAARKLAWEAAVMVQDPPHPAETWQTARVKWRQAIRLLEAIPDNAAISPQAQEKLLTYTQNYDTISKRLMAEKFGVENLELAQTLAWQAAVTAQHPPHPLPVWQRASRKWQEAIALLEPIPATTSVFAQSQQKLAIYRENYRNIQQRIEVELRAQELLEQFSNAAIQLNHLSANAPVGITVEEIGISYWSYASLVKRLETALTQFSRLPGARSHPVYGKLAGAIADYNNALKLWQAYLDFQQDNAAWLFGDSFHQLFPLETPETIALVQQYQLETVPSQSTEPKISLKFSVWKIWQQANNHLKQASQALPEQTTED